MVKSNKVWDRFANRYAKSPVSDEEAYQKKLEITRQYLGPEMQVLEFGCGTGSTAIVHAPLVKHILAIDVSEKMLNFGREKSEAANIDNISFELSGIENFESEGKKFDVIMGHSILHLLEDRDLVISKVFSLLKPGGVFISSTICMGDGYRIEKLILPIGKFFGLLPLVQFFGVKDLETSIKSAGYEIIHQWQPNSDSAVFIVAKKNQ